jgi:hypothetical protein
MKGIILLNSNENTHLVEEEEKAKFIRALLEEIGLPLEGIWDEDGQLSIEGKIKLRSILSTYQIQIIDSMDGELQVYHEDKIIGEFKKCNYVLKKDLKEKDPRKKLYLEMHVEYSSIFEKTE